MARGTGVVMGTRGLPLLRHAPLTRTATRAVVSFAVIVSEIRESMVKMMTTLRRSAVGGDFGEQRRFDAIVRGADWSKVLEGHQIPMNPSRCTFWCAIALGALVKGHPIESV